jgi:hypothetical protein
VAKETVLLTVEAARRLVENLGSRINEEELGNPLFTGPNVKIFPLDKTGFRTIRPVSSDCKIAFVDGGNQEIGGAPNFSVQINRLYFGMWNGTKRLLERVLPRRVEFFSLTISRLVNSQIFYDTLMFPLQEEHRHLLPEENDLSFNSFDRTVTVGTQRADIERVASIARVFAEWQFSIEIVKNELEAGDVLVVDRTLQTAFKDERKYPTKLVEQGKARGVTITGLSKTSTLFTDTGLSLIGALSKLAKDTGADGVWYFPVAEVEMNDHNAMILVVRLCDCSDRIFRYEIELEQFKALTDEQLNRVLIQLARNSSDAAFHGYPYGLVDADRFARVSFQDAEYYRALLFSQLSNKEDWEKLSRHMRAIDAHDVLNMISR